MISKPKRISCAAGVVHAILNLLESDILSLVCMINYTLCCGAIAYVKSLIYTNNTIMKAITTIAIKIDPVRSLR